MHESVAQNTLLDPRDFAFESPPIKSHNQSDELERKRLAKNARKSARRRQLREEREEAAQSSTRPQKKEESISINTSTAGRAHSGPPSPTPPLKHTREAVGGHFRFTDSERTYAIKYAQVLLARDHEISGHAIAAALYDKVGSILLSTLVIDLSVRCLIIRLAHGEVISVRPPSEMKLTGIASEPA